MTTVKQAMKAYFDSLVDQVWQTDRELPRAEVVEDADSLIYVGEPDRDGYVQWRPTEKNKVDDLGTLERRLGISLHSSVKEYFNSYWFLYLGGHLQRWAVRLFPVVPGLELAGFAASLEDLLKEHGHNWPWAPIGLETNTGFSVVVNARTGEVAAWNDETGVAEALAADLPSLIKEVR